jgi:hypothetical protein
VVLVCPLVPVKLHFHIKLVILLLFNTVYVARMLACFIFFFYAWEKNFEILLLGWLCKLFAKAMVIALARGALAMCLQMRWLIQFLSDF